MEVLTKILRYIYFIVGFLIVQLFYFVNQKKDDDEDKDKEDDGR